MKKSTRLTCTGCRKRAVETAATVERGRRVGFTGSILHCVLKLRSIWVANSLLTYIWVVIADRRWAAALTILYSLVKVTN